MHPLIPHGTTLLQMCHRGTSEPVFTTHLIIFVVGIAKASRLPHISKQCYRIKKVFLLEELLLNNHLSLAVKVCEYNTTITKPQMDRPPTLVGRLTGLRTPVSAPSRLDSKMPQLHPHRVFPKQTLLSHQTCALTDAHSRAQWR